MVTSPVDFNRKQIADGVLTPEHITELVTFWQNMHGLEADGYAGTGETIPSIERSTRQRAGQLPAPPWVIDKRKDARPKYAPIARPWNKVTGVCLHQTACVLGERPERYETMNCHIAVTRTGKVIWLYDFDKIVAHGNAWNTETVGIEIDGLYAGIEGDASTVWDDPSTARHETGMEVTPEAIEAAKQVVRWICAEVGRHGGHVRALVAHRQASKDRRNDPGSAIWQAVALPLHAELNLGDGGIGFKLGDGYAIPEAWDPRCIGVRY